MQLTRRRRFSMERVATITATAITIMAVAACGSSEQTKATDTPVPSSAWQQTEEGTVRGARGLSDCKNKEFALDLSRNQKSSLVSATGWGTTDLRLEFNDTMSIINVIAGDAGETRGLLGRPLNPDAMEVVSLTVDNFTQYGMAGTGPEMFSWVRLCLE